MTDKEQLLEKYLLKIAENLGQYRRMVCKCKPLSR